jgi:hypothetical protein
MGDPALVCTISFDHCDPAFFPPACAAVILSPIRALFHPHWCERPFAEVSVCVEQENIPITCNTELEKCPKNLDTAYDTVVAEENTPKCPPQPKN